MILEDETPKLEGVQYATGKEWRIVTNSFNKNEVTGPKQEWHSAGDMPGCESKVWCCTEQYCIGTWNVRSMNQGKLDMVKQEMARMNIGIFGISELKWMRTGKFNSDDHYIYYCGEESLKRNGIALTVNKKRRLKCSTWVKSQKWQKDLGLFPRQATQHHGNPSICPSHWCQRSWSWLALWRPTIPSKTNTKKVMSFSS